MWITEIEITIGQWARARVLSEPAYGWQTREEAQASAKLIGGHVRVRETNEVNLCD